MQFNQLAIKPHFLFWLLPFLAVQLPFEIDKPLLTVGSISFTNVELTLLLVLGGATIIGWQNSVRWPPLRWCILTIWFIVALFASAFSAKTFSGNAFRAAFRTLTGIALAIAVPQLIISRRQLKHLLTLLLLSGGITFLLGWLEVEMGRAFSILSLFRVTPSTAGPFVRLTGSFDYVNQTTMFAEALLPIAISAYVAWTSCPLVDRQDSNATNKAKTPAHLSLLLLIVLLFAVIILSLSRAAWVTGAGVLAVAFIWRRLAQRQWAFTWLVALGGFILLFIVSVVRYPVFSLRLQTESDTAWYVVDMDVPAQLTIQANDTSDVRISVRNQSPRDFRSDTVVPINIGVRWLDGQTQLGEQRQALGRLVANSAETYTFELEAPPKAGNFQLQWDLVEENITWFSDKTTHLFMTDVIVKASPSKVSSTKTFSNPRPKPQPLPPDATRGTLWRVAFTMWRDQPLTGVGLDNFRLLYGKQLGLAHWNDLLHTNNWYIETLVSFGLFGATPFFAWLFLLLNDIRRVTLATADHMTWAIALALLTFYSHGLLDYFLIFNSTGLLFWLLVGCWLFVRDYEHDQSTI